MLVEGRICREINVFPRFEYHMFYVLYPFVTYLLTLPRIFAFKSLGGRGQFVLTFVKPGDLYKASERLSKGVFNLCSDFMKFPFTEHLAFLLSVFWGWEGPTKRNLSLN
jgi:hypothetical protein